jgi:hypothetical protein
MRHTLLAVNAPFLAVKQERTHASRISTYCIPVLVFDSAHAPETASLSPWLLPPPDSFRLSSRDQASSRFGRIAPVQGGWIYLLQHKEYRLSQLPSRPSHGDLYDPNAST